MKIIYCQYCQCFIMLHYAMVHGETTDEWYKSTYEWHTDDIRVTYRWYAVQKKNKVNFFKALYKISFKISNCRRIPCMQVLFGLFTKIEKGSGISFWCTFSA